jgi:hypothetical protein
MICRPALVATSSLGVPPSVSFAHATPRSIQLTRTEGVLAALTEHRTGLTYPPRLQFPAESGIATLAFRRKEHRRFDPTARGVLLPTTRFGGNLFPGLRRAHCGYHRELLSHSRTSDH